MLSKSFTDRSIPMNRDDAYTMSNIMASIYGIRRSYAYAYSVREEIPVNKLVLWYSTDAPQCVPVYMNSDKFPYTIKELLTYLYDKIESN
jgi:hypothetical protein